MKKEIIAYVPLAVDILHWDILTLLIKPINMAK